MKLLRNWSQAGHGRGRCADCKPSAGAWGTAEGLIGTTDLKTISGQSIDAASQALSYFLSFAAGLLSCTIRSTLFREVSRGRVVVLEAYIAGLACCCIFG